MKIKEVMVFGANGNMGSKISAIFSSFGDANVYMVGRSTISLKKSINDAKKSIRSSSIEKKLHMLTYDNCIDKIREADLIIEAVAESMDIKLKTFTLISKYINANAIIATCTSGLSINELSKVFSIHQRERFLGIHFFNPPYSMTLCEIIPCECTSKKVIDFIFDYTIKILYRTSILSKDTPAFIANRIGFQFINMCMIYAEKYKEKGGIEFINSIIGPFTGRNMSPLITADFVGLDITKSIVDNVYKNSKDFFHEYFKLPSYVEELVQQNKCGLKTNEGLYKQNDIDGVKQYFVYDIDKKRYTEKQNFEFEFAKEIVENIKKGNYEKFKEVLYEFNSLESNLCLELLSQYIIYSIYIGKEIGNNVFCVDDVMATGFNWIPPLALMDSLGGKALFFSTIKKKNFEYLKMVNIDEIIKLCPDKSIYSFKKFLKAKM